MPRCSLNSARVLERAVRMALLCSWIGFVAWKVTVLLSEPTGSLTRWDGEFDRPFITVCPYHAFDRELRQIIECGTDEEKEQLFENYTLLELFKTEGLALDKMFQEYYWDDYNSSRENLPDENGVWFLKVNYAHGGLCATFKMEKDYETVFILSRWPDYEQNKTDYYSNNSCSRDDDCYSQYYYGQYYDSQTDSFTETSDGSSPYEDGDRQYEIKSENLMSAIHSSPSKRLPLAASNPHRMHYRGQARSILKDDNPATEWESQDSTRHERGYARLQSYFHDRFEASVHPDTTEGTQEPGVLAGSYAAFDETRVNRFVTPIGKKIVVENPGIAYRIHIHGMDDFWGAEDKELTSSSDAEMATFALLTSFSNQELVVHVDREVMPNLRRQPCEEDPSYSRNRCWRQCFMNWLENWLECSIDGGNDKPTCSAYVFECFEDKYMAFAESAQENSAENIPWCSCPQPCIKHRYSIYVRPGEHDSTDTWFYVPVTFRPVQRTIETFVTYSFSDLLADMGGYMGLLLGYSILSIFDDFKTLARTLFCRWLPKKAASGDDSLSVMESGALKPCSYGVSRRPVQRGRLQQKTSDKRRNRRLCWRSSVRTDKLAGTKTLASRRGRVPSNRQEADIFKIA